MHSRLLGVHLNRQHKGGVGTVCTTTSDFPCVHTASGDRKRQDFDSFSVRSECAHLPVPPPPMHAVTSSESRLEHSWMSSVSVLYLQ
eukprot:5688325-Prymnesium_polylepis.2